MTQDSEPRGTPGKADLDQENMSFSMEEWLASGSADRGSVDPDKHTAKRTM